MRADLRLAEELPPDWEGRDMIVVGVVAEMPQSFARGERFVFAVEKVLTEGHRCLAASCCPGTSPATMRRCRCAGWSPG